MPVPIPEAGLQVGSLYEAAAQAAQEQDELALAGALATIDEAIYSVCKLSGEDIEEIDQALAEQGVGLGSASEPG